MSRNTSTKSPVARKSFASLAKQKRSLILAAAVAGIGLFAGRASALSQDGQWAATSGGNWFTASSWQGGTIPMYDAVNDPYNGAEARFLQAGSTQAVTVNGAAAISALVFQQGGDWTFNAGSGGTLTLTGANGVYGIGQYYYDLSYAYNASQTAMIAVGPARTTSGGTTPTDDGTSFTLNMNLASTTNLIKVGSGEMIINSGQSINIAAPLAGQPFRSFTIAEGTVTFSNSFLNTNSRLLIGTDPGGGTQTMGAQPAVLRYAGAGTTVVGNLRSLNTQANAGIQVDGSATLSLTGPIGPGTSTVPTGAAENPTYDLTYPAGNYFVLIKKGTGNLELNPLDDGIDEATGELRLVNGVPVVPTNDPIANSYYGNIFVDDGTLSIYNLLALGDGRNRLILDGGTFRIYNRKVASTENLWKDGTTKYAQYDLIPTNHDPGNGADNAGGGNGKYRTFHIGDQGGTIDVQAFQLQINDGAVYDTENQLQGTGVLTKAGPGTLLLGSPDHDFTQNTNDEGLGRYTGQWSGSLVVDAGTVRLDHFRAAGGHWVPFSDYTNPADFTPHDITVNANGTLASGSGTAVPNNILLRGKIGSAGDNRTFSGMVTVDGDVTFNSQDLNTDEVIRTETINGNTVVHVVTSAEDATLRVDRTTTLSGPFSDAGVARNLQVTGNAGNAVHGLALTNDSISLNAGTRFNVQDGGVLKVKLSADGTSTNVPAANIVLNNVGATGAGPIIGYLTDTAATIANPIKPADPSAGSWGMFIGSLSGGTSNLTMGLNEGITVAANQQFSVSSLQNYSLLPTGSIVVGDNGGLGAYGANLLVQNTFTYGNTLNIAGNSTGYVKLAVPGVTEYAVNQLNIKGGNLQVAAGQNLKPLSLNFTAGGIVLGADATQGSKLLLTNDISVTGNGQLVAENGSTLPAVDLGGVRTIGVGAGATLTSNARITNGTLVKAGDGTLVLQATSDYTGGTQITGGVVSINGVKTNALGTGDVTLAGGTLRMTIPVMGNRGGLAEAKYAGNIYTGAIDRVDRYVLEPIMAQTRDDENAPGYSTNWGPNDQTFVYSGQVWADPSKVQADGTVYLGFAENIDDQVQLYIDGNATAVLNDGTWNNPTSKTLAVSPGWHNFELRVSNGGGGAGPSGANNAGWTNWVQGAEGGIGTGFIMAVAPAGQVDLASWAPGTDVNVNWFKPIDNGSMNIFRVNDPNRNAYTVSNKVIAAAGATSAIEMADTPTVGGNLRITNLEVQNGATLNFNGTGRILDVTNTALTGAPGVVTFGGNATARLGAIDAANNTVGTFAIRDTVNVSWTGAINAGAIDTYGGRTTGAGTINLTGNTIRHLGTGAGAQVNTTVNAGSNAITIDVADGTDVRDLIMGTVNAGSVTKTGTGRLVLAGTNGSTGPLGITAGALSLAGDNPIGANTVTLANDTILNLGTAEVRNGVMAEGKYGGTSQAVYQGAITTINGYYDSPRFAQIRDEEGNGYPNGWGPNNQTYVYSGQIYIDPAMEGLAFAEQIDDEVLLRIDGQQVLYNTVWNVPTAGKIQLSPGWHNFDLRVSNGGGGAGPVDGNGWTTTKGFGVQIMPLGTDFATWDPGTNGANYTRVDSDLASFFRYVGTYSALTNASSTNVIAEGNATVSMDLAPAGTVTQMGVLTMPFNSTNYLTTEGPNGTARFASTTLVSDGSITSLNFGPAGVIRGDGNIDLGDVTFPNAFTAVDKTNVGDVMFNGDVTVTGGQLTISSGRLGGAGKFFLQGASPKVSYTGAGTWARAGTIRSGIDFGAANAAFDATDVARNAVDLQVNGVVTAGGGLVKTGPGTVRLSAPVQLNGAVHNITGGSLILGASKNDPTGADPTANKLTGTLNVSNNANVTITDKAVEGATVALNNGTLSLQATPNGYTSPTGLTFGDGSGIVVNGDGSYDPGTGILTVTKAVNSQSTSLFLTERVPSGAFHVEFTYNGNATKVTDPADGLAFVIHNDERQYTARGDAGNALTYGGGTAISPSASIQFDNYTRSGISFGANGTIVETGTAGAYDTTTQAQPMDLRSGNDIRVVLDYWGTTLTGKFTDLVTGNSFTTEWANINLPSLVGGSTAIVGFTGSTGGLNSNQTIKDFYYGKLVSEFGVNVRADGNSTLNFDAGVLDGRLGALTVGSNATFNTTGAGQLVNFTSTTFEGVNSNVTLNITPKVNFGNVTQAGSFGTLIKDGPGDMTFTGTIKTNVLDMRAGNLGGDVVEIVPGASSPSIITPSAGTAVLGATLQIDGQTVTVNANGTGPNDALIISGPVLGSAAGRLVKEGAGKLVLQGDNSVGGYGGGTALNTGTLVLAGGNSIGTGTLDMKGNTTVAFGLRAGVPGFNESVVNNTGSINFIQDRTSTGVTLSTRLGGTNTKDASNWGDNQMWIYEGWFYDADGKFTFGESIDDAVVVVIDHVERYRDGAWDNRPIVPVDLNGIAGADPDGPYNDGWHKLQVRLWNGGGGAGQVNAPGLGFYSGITTDWNLMTLPTDQGDGELFRTDWKGVNSYDGGNNVNVTANAFETVTFDVSPLMPGMSASMGKLTLNNSNITIDLKGTTTGSTVDSGRNVSFTATDFKQAGSYTFQGSGRLALGQINLNNQFVTIYNKTTGALTLDYNDTPVDLSKLTLDVTGRLKVVLGPNDPTGGAFIQFSQFGAALVVASENDSAVPMQSVPSFSYDGTIVHEGQYYSEIGNGFEPLSLQSGALTLNATNAAGVLKINAPVSTSQSVTKTGPGTVIIGGPLAVGGYNNEIQAGVLQLNGAYTSTGGPSTPINVRGGATLQLGADNVIASNQAINLDEHATFNLNGFKYTYGGTGALDVQRYRTYDTGGPTGELTVQSGVVNLTGGSIVGQGTLKLQGATPAINSLGDAVRARLDSNVDLGGMNVPINVTDDSYTANTDLVMGGVLSNGSITKQGQGRLLLSGNNLHANTVIPASDNSVTFVDAGAMGTGEVQVGEGATVTIGHGIQGLKASVYAATNDPVQFGTDPFADYVKVTSRFDALETGAGIRAYVTTTTINMTGGDGRSAGKALSYPTNFANVGLALGGTYADNYAARLDGMIHITEEGDYEFQTRSDDGSFFFIDHDQDPATNMITVSHNNSWQGVYEPQYNVAGVRVAPVHLTPGYYPVLIGMYEGGGGDGLVVNYRKVSGPGTSLIGGWETIPNDVLYSELTLPTNMTGTADFVMQNTATIDISGAPAGTNFTIGDLKAPSFGTLTVKGAGRTIGFATSNDLGGKTFTINGNGGVNLGAVTNPISTLNVQGTARVGWQGELAFNTINLDSGALAGPGTLNFAPGRVVNKTTPGESEIASKITYSGGQLNLSQGELRLSNTDLANASDLTGMPISVPTATVLRLDAGNGAGANPANNATITLDGGVVEAVGNGVKNGLEWSWFYQQRNTYRDNGVLIQTWDLHDTARTENLLYQPRNASNTILYTGSVSFGSDQEWSDKTVVDGDPKGSFTDDYQSLFTGSLVVKEAAAYQFRMDISDDRSAFYVDMNGNGTPELSERVIYGEVFGSPGVTSQALGLQPGTYKTWLAQAEFSGGSTARLQYAINGGAFTTVEPGHFDQQNMWLAGDPIDLNFASTNVMVNSSSSLSLLGKSAQYGNLGFNSGVTLTTTGIPGTIKFTTTQFPAGSSVTLAGTTKLHLGAANKASTLNIEHSAGVSWDGDLTFDTINLNSGKLIGDGVLKFTGNSSFFKNNDNVADLSIRIGGTGANNNMYVTQGTLSLSNTNLAAPNDLTNVAVHVGAGSTLRIDGKDGAGANPANNGVILMEGGTVDASATIGTSGLSNGLDWSWYYLPRTGSPWDLHDKNLSENLLNQPTSWGNTLVRTGQVSFTDDGNWSLQSNYKGNFGDDYQHLFQGYLVVSETSTWQFRMDISDDRTSFYVDSDQDGIELSDRLLRGDVFGTPGISSPSIVLQPGAYPIYMAQAEFGGGSTARLMYSVNGGAMTIVEPGASGQDGVWMHGTVGTIADFSSTDIQVEQSSTLKLSATGAQFGTLKFNGWGTTLTTAGSAAPVKFEATRFADFGGSFTVNAPRTPIYLGNLNDTNVSGVATLEIQGAAGVFFDDNVGTNITTKTQFNIAAGSRATAILGATDPTGGATINVGTGATFAFVREAASATPVWANLNFNGLYGNLEYISTTPGVYGDATHGISGTGVVSLRAIGSTLELRGPVNASTVAAAGTIIVPADGIVQNQLVARGGTIDLQPGVTYNTGTFGIGQSGTLNVPATTTLKPAGFVADGGVVSIAAGGKLVAPASGIVGAATGGPSFIAGPGSLDLAVSNTFNIADGGARYDMTVAAPIVNAAGLNKTGGGTLRITEAQTFAGAINVSGGALVAPDDAVLGNAGNVVNLTNGGALFGVTSLAGTTMPASRAITVGAGGGTVGAHRSEFLPQFDTFRIESPISGTGTVRIGGGTAATIEYTGAFSAGGARIPWGTTLNMTSTAPFGTAPVAVDRGAVVRVNNQGTDLSNWTFGYGSTLNVNTDIGSGSKIVMPVSLVGVNFNYTNGGIAAGWTTALNKSMATIANDAGEFRSPITVSGGWGILNMTSGQEIYSPLSTTDGSMLFKTGGSEFWGFDLGAGYNGAIVFDGGRFELRDSAAFKNGGASARAVDVGAVLDLNNVSGSRMADVLRASDTPTPGGRVDVPLALWNGAELRLRGDTDNNDITDETFPTVDAYGFTHLQVTRGDADNQPQYVDMRIPSLTTNPGSLFRFAAGNSNGSNNLGTSTDGRAGRIFITNVNGVALPTSDTTIIPWGFVNNTEQFAINTSNGIKPFTAMKTTFASVTAPTDIVQVNGNAATETTIASATTLQAIKFGDVIGAAGLKGNFTLNANLTLTSGAVMFKIEDDLLFKGAGKLVAGSEASPAMMYFTMNVGDNEPVYFNDSTGVISKGFTKAGNEWLVFEGTDPNTVMNDFRGGDFFHVDGFTSFRGIGSLGNPTGSENNSVNRFFIMTNSDGEGIDFRHNTDANIGNDIYVLGHGRIRTERRTAVNGQRFTFGDVYVNAGRTLVVESQYNASQTYSSLRFGTNLAPKYDALGNVIVDDNPANRLGQGNAVRFEAGNVQGVGTGQEQINHRVGPMSVDGNLAMTVNAGWNYRITVTADSLAGKGDLTLNGLGLTEVTGASPTGYTGNVNVTQGYLRVAGDALARPAADPGVNSVYVDPHAAVEFTGPSSSGRSPNVYVAEYGGVGGTLDSNVVLPAQNVVFLDTFSVPFERQSQRATDWLALTYNASASGQRTVVDPANSNFKGIAMGAYSGHEIAGSLESLSGDLNILVSQHRRFMPANQTAVQEFKSATGVVNVYGPAKMEIQSYGVNGNGNHITGYSIINRYGEPTDQNTVTLAYQNVYAMADGVTANIWNGRFDATSHDYVLGPGTTVNINEGATMNFTRVLRSGTFNINAGGVGFVSGGILRFNDPGATFNFKPGSLLVFNTEGDMTNNLTWSVAANADVILPHQDRDVFTGPGLLLGEGRRLGTSNNNNADLTGGTGLGALPGVTNVGLTAAPGRTLEINDATNLAGIDVKVGDFNPLPTVVSDGDMTRRLYVHTGTVRIDSASATMRDVDLQSGALIVNDEATDVFSARSLNLRSSTAGATTTISTGTVRVTGSITGTTPLKLNETGTLEFNPGAGNTAVLSAPTQTFGKVVISSGTVDAGTQTIGDLRVGPMAERYYKNDGDSYITFENASNTFLTLTPGATGTLKAGEALDFSNSATAGIPVRAKNPDGSNYYTSADHTGVAWVGTLTVGYGDLPAGDITFATRSDDGSTLYVDVNGDHVFTANEMVVNNKGGHGEQNRFGVRNLPAGTYDMAIGWYNGTGGSAVRVRLAPGNIPQNDAGYNSMSTLVPRQNQVEVAAGASLIAGKLFVSSLSLGDGATVVLKDGAVPTQNMVSNLVLGTDAKLEIGHNALHVDASDEAALNAAVVAGVIDSVALDDTTDPLLALKTLAVLDTDGGLGTQALLKVTWKGESNGDGIVDGDDYAVIDANFLRGTASPLYSQGNYDYVGGIDGDDYFAIDSSFLGQNAVLAAGAADAGGLGNAAVPEPGTLGLLAVGALGLLARRRRNA